MGVGKSHFLVGKFGTFLKFELVDVNHGLGFAVATTRRLACHAWRLVLAHAYQDVARGALRHCDTALATLVVLSWLVGKVVNVGASRVATQVRHMIAFNEDVHDGARALEVVRLLREVNYLVHGQKTGAVETVAVLWLVRGLLQELAAECIAAWCLGPGAIDPLVGARKRSLQFLLGQGCDVGAGDGTLLLVCSTRLAVVFLRRN